MDVERDYADLIDLFKDIEKFDMQNPAWCWTLAYVMDQLKDKEDYQKIIGRWKDLAKTKDYNELAWAILNTGFSLAQEDERVAEYDMSLFKIAKETGHNDYKNGSLSSYGYVHQSLAPDWFLASSEKIAIPD